MTWDLINKQWRVIDGQLRLMLDLGHSLSRIFWAGNTVYAVPVGKFTIFQKEIA